MNAFSTNNALPSSRTSPDDLSLLADIGGTNARFGLARGAGPVHAIKVLACADHATLADALRAYLAIPQIAAAGTVLHAAIAIANPVVGDFVRMTNHHWEFSVAALGRQMGFETFVVVNDFTALARALPHLTDSDKRQIGTGAPVAHAPIGLVGAGTGLGVSGLIASSGPPVHGTEPHWTALRSEGGHVTFSPANQAEVAILQFAWRKYEHVSAERLLSGAGLELIYCALAEQQRVQPGALAGPEIMRRALADECGLCKQVIETFCGVLGTVAGNLAVTLGAHGGIYIGGGIVPRLGEYFDRSCFRMRFEQKGRLVKYLGDVPTYVVTAEYPALIGALAILTEMLGSHSSAPSAG